MRQATGPIKIDIKKKLISKSSKKENEKMVKVDFFRVPDADLSDQEIDNICQGRTQNAAKVRHLKKMGLQVRQKPNGRALVNRAHYDNVTSQCYLKSAFNEPRWSSN